MSAAVLEIFRGQDAKDRKQKERIFVDSAGSAYKVGNLNKALSDLAHKEGWVKDITFLTLRHSFARNLIQKNFSFINLYKMLGFSDVAEVMVYFPFLLGKKEDILTSSTHSI